MQNSEIVKQLKNTLLDFCPIAIEELKAIITSKKSSEKVKLDAITLLFDRVGLPALRASISQTLVSSPIDLTGLLERKNQLALSDAKLESDLLEIEAKLGKANPVTDSCVRGSVSSGR